MPILPGPCNQGTLPWQPFLASVGYNFGCTIASKALFDSCGEFSGVKLSNEDIANIEVLTVVAMATIFRLSVMASHWRQLANTTEPPARTAAMRPYVKLL